MTEEELKRQTEREIRWRIGFRLLPWGLLILIICIGLLKDCVRSRDPIDDSINRSQEVVRHLEVCDTTRNGFRVVYVTNNAVTTERLNEIRLRRPLNLAFCKLQDSAAFYFGGACSKPTSTTLPHTPAGSMWTMTCGCRTSSFSALRNRNCMSERTHG